MTNIYIKDAVEELGISKSQLYRRIKQLGLVTHREGNKRYLTPKQIDQLKEVSHCVDTRDTVILDLKKQLKEKELFYSQRTEQLNREVGQWQGRAKTLEELNEKLLVLGTPKEPKKKGFFRRLLQ
jgi:hypothetical protein